MPLRENAQRLLSLLTEVRDAKPDARAFAWFDRRDDLVKAGVPRAHVDGFAASHREAVAARRVAERARGSGHRCRNRCSRWSTTRRPTSCRAGPGTSRNGAGPRNGTCRVSEPAGGGDAGSVRELGRLRSSDPPLGTSAGAASTVPDPVRTTRASGTQPRVRRTPHGAPANSSAARLGQRSRVPAGRARGIAIAG